MPASYLPRRDYKKIENVGHAIRCTGPLSDVAIIPFAIVVERAIGFALSTASFLAQIAASDYPDELAFLYYEFAESYNPLSIPNERPLLLSIDALKQRLPSSGSNLCSQD